MAKKFLDYSGLERFLDKVKEWATELFATKDVASTTESGLMSSSDKKKLDGIANSANAYSLPNATSTTLGGVKIGSNISVNSGTISLTKSNVTSALGYTPPTTDTTYGLATSTSNGLMSSSRAKIVVPNAWDGADTFGDESKEKNTYIYGKSLIYIAPDSSYHIIHTGNIGSQKAGSAGVADKLGSSVVGSTTKPIYLNNGEPKECTYTLGTSVPSNAKFTDTTYSGMTAEEATSGSSTTNRLISPKVLHDKIAKEIDAIPVMVGATSSSTGVAGLVPTPSSGNQTKYLKGDGTWGNPSVADKTVQIDMAVSTEGGWYRCYKSKRGIGVGEVVYFNITSLYSNTPSISQSFVITLSQNNAQISQIGGCQDSFSLVPKIRVDIDNVTEDTTLRRFYIDIFVQRRTGVAHKDVIYIWGEGIGSFLTPQLIEEPIGEVVEKDITYGNVASTLDAPYTSKLLSVPQRSNGVIYDSLPYLNNDVNIFNPLLSNIVTSPNGAPFGRSFLINGAVELESEIMPLRPGETIKIETWFMRKINADIIYDENGKPTYNEDGSVAKHKPGVVYVGMRIMDKNGLIAGANGGRVYFNNMVGITIPMDDKWYYYTSTYTVPVSHTPYPTNPSSGVTQSDGGGIYYGSCLVYVNNRGAASVSGTIPTYLGGFRFTRLTDGTTGTNKGVKIELSDAPYIPTPKITVTTGGVNASNTGVVSGAEVKSYVDANKGVNTVFKAQTSSSNAVNGLVPAPSSANATKYLRGDGTWKDGSDIINSLTIGTSPAQREDYVVAQWAGGGTTTTTYHRRSLKNIFSSLNDEDIKNALPGVMIWGGLLNTAAYATDYSVGTVLKVNTSESLYILKGSSLMSTSVALGTKLIVSHESYTSGTSNTSGKVFVEF